MDPSGLSEASRRACSSVQPYSRAAANNPVAIWSSNCPISGFFRDHLVWMVVAPLSTSRLPSGSPSVCELTVTASYFCLSR